jgi:hypothetical protein
MARGCGLGPRSATLHVEVSPGRIANGSYRTVFRNLPRDSDRSSPGAQHLIGRRPGPLLAAAATSIPPEAPEPVRRKRRVDGRAGDRPMVAMREQIKSEKGQGRRHAKYTTDDAAMAESLRRFPPRWRGDPMPCGYVVRTPTGTRSRTSTPATTNTPATTKLRPGSKDADEGEARRVAVNVARQPSAAQIYSTAAHPVRRPSLAPMPKVRDPSALETCTR